MAHLVMSALVKKYQPQDTITRVELRQQLSAERMKSNEDPATLFEQLSSKENRYNTSAKKIDEEDMIAVVLDSAPIEYQAILTAEQEIKGASVTLSDLKVVMNQYWQQTSASRERSASESKDNDNLELNVH
jgi:hypothetical protein